MIIFVLFYTKSFRKKVAKSVSSIGSLNQFIGDLEEILYSLQLTRKNSISIFMGLDSLGISASAFSAKMLEPRYVRTMHI